MTHSIILVETAKSLAIIGAAILTMEESSDVINVTSEIAKSPIAFLTNFMFSIITSTKALISGISKAI